SVEKRCCVSRVTLHERLSGQDRGWTLRLLDGVLQTAGLQPQLAVDRVDPPFVSRLIEIVQLPLKDRGIGPEKQIRTRGGFIRGSQIRWLNSRLCQGRQNRCQNNDSTCKKLAVPHIKIPLSGGTKSELVAACDLCPITTNWCLR